MLKYLLAGTLAVTAFTAHAQERTAGSSLDTQMTWTALAAQTKAASDKADAVNTRVDQAVLCGKKGKLYAPGVTADGCLEASSNSGSTLTQIISNLNTLNTNQTATNNNLTNVINCQKAGQGFDGTKCVANKPDIITVASSTGKGPFGTTVITPAACPTGYSMISCSGIGGGYGTMNGNACSASKPGMKFVDSGSNNGNGGGAGCIDNTCWTSTQTASRATCLKN